MLKIAFWASVGVVLYTYLGYPILICLLSKIRPAGCSVASPSASAAPRVTLIIPAYNEELWIERKIRNALALDYPRDRMQILVASDGSTDRTVEIARRFAEEGVEVAHFPGPAGKMTTLNRVMAQTGGEVVLLTDATALLEADALRWLTPYFADSAVGCVAGDRACLATSSLATHGEGQYWRYEAWIKRSESRYGSCLGAYGQLYAVRRSLFPFIPGTSDDFYVPMNILISTGARTVFEPRARASVPAAATLPGEFRRKVRTHVALFRELPRLSTGLIPWRSKIWWEFWSHHVLRLFVPWSMFTALGASAFLWSDGTAYQLAFWAQILLYAMAVIGLLLLLRKRKRGPAQPCFYFVFANVAVAVAWFEYLRGGNPYRWQRTERLPDANREAKECR